ncbi:hypothetical protein [Kitasatospora sp. NPDC059327]|uniref:hypothetical protein n=1 Tax=Kitasatospora sp. NPDC059327 TaxID=3346803 RepID=UPI003674B33C
MNISLSFLVIVGLVLAMFTVLAVIGLTPDAVIALGSTACMGAAELIRHLAATTHGRRRQ